MTTVVLVAVVLIAIATWLARLRWWPYGPCPRCSGHRRKLGRGLGSSSAAWSRCRRCDGSGEVLRRGAKIWRRWR